MPKKTPIEQLKEKFVKADSRDIETIISWEKDLAKLKLSKSFQSKPEVKRIAGELEKQISVAKDEMATDPVEFADPVAYRIRQIKLMERANIYLFLLNLITGADKELENIERQIEENLE